MGHRIRHHTRQERRRLPKEDDTTEFVCFYCHGRLAKGSGRRFRATEDGPIWEVHAEHAILSSEIPAG